MPDFPSTPVNGDTHVIATSTWEYYSSTDRWEIQDTSGVPQQATTLLYTLTPSAGDVTVESGSINYSDFTTIIVTYTGIASDTADTQFQFAKSISEIHTSSAAEPRIYTAGDGTLVMAGTTTILPSTGTANSNTTINTTITDVENLSVIGSDFSTLIFGWESSTTTFAAGGTIEIRGVSLLIASDQLEHLGNVQDVIPQSGDYLAWNGTAWTASGVVMSFASLTGKPTTLAGYGITDAFDGTYATLTGTPTTLAGYGIIDSLESLSNVDTTSPTDGQVLAWDNTNSYWKPAAPASGGGNAVEFISYSGVINNAATVDFTGFDASKYVSYFFELNDVRHDQTVAVSPPVELYLSLATSVPTSTLLETLTWSAGAATVTSSPIVYSNYVTLIITYTNVASNASVTTFEMRKPTGHIAPRNYNSGEGVLPMNGTQTITTSSGASSSVINLNGTVVTTAHSNTIGNDYDPITFGWTAGAFAAGGSIEIRGISTYDKTAGNYHYGGMTDSAGFKLAASFSNQNMGATGQFRIYNPHVAAYTMGFNEVAASYQPASGAPQAENIYGGHIVNSNAKQMYLNTGSITAAQFWISNDTGNGVISANHSISSGEIRMYGLRKN